MNPLSPEAANAANAAALRLVTVLVVTHDSAHCLNRLNGLLAQCPFVVIADNGSTDGTQTLASSLWPKAQVIELGHNLGFGVANNRALASVTTPFAFLLNPDCVVGVADLLRLIGTAHEYPDAAVIAPQLAGAQGKAEVNYRWPQTHWRPKSVAASGPLCVGFVCGAAMLLRMARFETIGFFDERFFLYYEDDDLCLRLFNARRPIIVVPEVQAVHYARGSSRGAQPWQKEYVRGFHHVQSKLIFASKHQSEHRARRLRARLFCTTFLAMPLRVLAFSPKHIARMAGRWMGLVRWRPA